MQRYKVGLISLGMVLILTLLALPHELYSSAFPTFRLNPHYEVVYIDPTASDLPASAKTAVLRALDRWQGTLPNNNRFHLVGLRGYEDWAIVTLTFADLATPLDDGQESPISHDNLFSVLLVRTQHGWDAALDSDSKVRHLLEQIPGTELSESARQVIFLDKLASSESRGTAISQEASQQYHQYEFPWRSDEDWKANSSRGFHGCCSDEGQRVNGSLDFSRSDGRSGDILAAASGTIIYIVNDGFQTYLAVVTEGTNGEMIGYRHLDPTTMPEHIIGQCEYSGDPLIGRTCRPSIDVEKGAYLGRTKEVYGTFTTRVGTIAGTHLHLAVPTTPFIMNGVTFDKGSVPAGILPNSLQTDPSDNPEPDELPEVTGVFPDVPPTHPFFTYVETLYHIGAVNGYSDGTFRPDNVVNRAETAKIIILALGEQYLEDELEDPPVEPFSDVPADHPFYAYIMRMKELEITTGYSDGTYRPDEPLSRGQAAKFLTIAHDGEEPPSYTCTVIFPDVPCDHTFYDHIRRLKEIFDSEGESLGYSDGTYRPDELITRGEMSKLTVVALDWLPIFPDVEYSHPFYRYIQYLARRGVVSGYSDGTFRPEEQVRRGEFAKMIVRGLGITPDANDYPFATFSDVPRSHAFYAYIEYLASHGIVGGYSDGTFRPDEPITRGQIAKIVVGAVAEVLHVTCQYDEAPPFSDIDGTHLF